MLQELIDTYEELKKYVFIISRGPKNKIVFRFKNENFYHLVELHKTNINMFIPDFIKTKDKKYKYIKKNVKKFDNILENQINQKDLLEFRVSTFKNILDLLKENKNTTLYDLRYVPDRSMYDGDFGLLKIYEDINCLLGLKKEEEIERTIYCAPQSWMASNRVNKLVEFKRPIYMDKIITFKAEEYKDDSNVLYV